MKDDSKSWGEFYDAYSHRPHVIVRNQEIEIRGRSLVLHEDAGHRSEVRNEECIRKVNATIAREIEPFPHIKMVLNYTDDNFNPGAHEFVLQFRVGSHTFLGNGSMQENLLQDHTGTMNLILTRTVNQTLGFDTLGKEEIMIIRFYLPNFVCPLELSAGNWRIKLSNSPKDDGSVSFIEIIRQESKALYSLSHIGTLTRGNGEQFTLKQALGNSK